MCFFHGQFPLNKPPHETVKMSNSRVGTDVTVTGMDPCGFEGVEPPNRTKLCRCRRLSAVSVGRGTLKPDSFRDRNSVLIQGNEKHKTVTHSRATVLCFHTIKRGEGSRVSPSFKSRGRRLPSPTKTARRPCATFCRISSPILPMSC